MATYNYIMYALLSSILFYSLRTLNKVEVWWRDHYTWLESRGYTLRPRLTPGWVPSWKPGLGWATAEDAQQFIRASVTSATRVSDGTMVIMKRIAMNSGGKEEQVATKFGTGPLAQHPNNHCVPLLDVLHLDSEQWAILVVPLLRPLDNPSWDTVGEVVECIRQVFEGINFMHINGAAHRDCTPFNIMMDATHMYPQSFHPIEHDKRPDFKGSAPHYTRTQKPPRYYLIDFGLTILWDAGTRPPLYLPVYGGDKSLPECRTPQLGFDPMPSDIYYLGNWIVTEFLEKYKGLDCLQELAIDMTKTDPNERYTENVVSSLSGLIEETT